LRFLIGEFDKAKLAEIADLKLFGEFLEEDDLEIYDWILGKYQEPKHFKELVSQV